MCVYVCESVCVHVESTLSSHIRYNLYVLMCDDASEVTTQH